jgi:hypothetical protein
MKLLIFTEHKDTLDFLAGDGKDGRPLGKLVEWGLSVTQIHGGMKIGNRNTPGSRIFAERELRQERECMIGDIQHIGRAWVLPHPDRASPQIAPMVSDPEIERIAIQFVIAHEEARDWKVESVEQDNRGFDLISRKPHPEDPKTAIEVRFIEVKGRANTGEIALPTNEYNTAKRLRKDNWLYVVFQCATPNPSLNILHAPSTLDWQPIVKVERYRLNVNSPRHPVELREEPPSYHAGGPTLENELSSLEPPMKTNRRIHRAI